MVVFGHTEARIIQILCKYYAKVHRPKRCVFHQAVCGHTEARVIQIIFFKIMSVCSEDKTILVKTVNMINNSLKNLWFQSNRLHVSQMCFFDFEFEFGANNLALLNLRLKLLLVLASSFEENNFFD